MYKSFENKPLISRVIAKLRDKETRPPAFRAALFKLGQYLSYEISGTLPTIQKNVESPLGKAKYLDISENLVIASILRAALPMAEGVLDEFPDAHFGFLSASREEIKDEKTKDFAIIQNYIKMPMSKDKIVIVVDPMLATGSTLVRVLSELNKTNPSKIIVLSAIASQFGIDKIQKTYPDIEIYTGAIDQDLNEKGYIIPGLGDAGDRAYNTPQK